MFLLCKPSYCQDKSEDSLLKKINDMDVSLNSIDDNEEDLYMMSVSFQSFYDELSPVGEWIKISKDEINDDLKDGEGQGFSSDIIQQDEDVYIWRPTGVDDGWHPYLNGKWIYTTQGWLWASNYSWGWAVYHYGRWWNSKLYGWVWLPGHVWAPAWVRWKITDGHIGWCPLSPYAKWNIYTGITLNNYHYTHRDEDWIFVNKSGFMDEISQKNRVDVSRNGSYLQKANDVLNIKYENSRMQNYGPDVKDIENKLGKKIIAKEIKVTKNKNKPLVGDNDVSIYKENFNKLEIDQETGKVKQKLSPKVYKIAKKIKKHIIRKRLRHKLHHLKK
jgi:hypothetical protein